MIHLNLFRAIHFNSLRFKISALTVLILAGLLFIFGSFFSVIFWSVLNRELDNTLQVKHKNINNAMGSYLNVLGTDERSFRFAAHRVITQAGSHPHQNKIEKIERLWTDQRNAMEINHDYIHLTGRKGESLAKSVNVKKDFPVLPFESIQSALAGRTLFKKYRLKNEDLRTLTAPVIYRNAPLGVLFIATSRESVNHIMRKVLAIEMFLAFFVLVIASALSQFFAKGILRPIENIIRTVGRIDYRDLSVRLSSENIDVEMKVLVDSLNEMISRLERAFKHIAEFSSHVSHELKTPLAIMRGESEIAMKGNLKPGEYQKVIRDNLEEVARMERVINDLLLLARLNYEPQVFSFEKFDLPVFFGEIEEAGRILASQKNIDLTVDLSRAPGAVRGDQVHLRRLFFNLINNAVKFTSPGGKINIAVERKGGDVLIFVSDTGAGIPEQNLPLVFQEFFHDEGQNRNVSKGLGLGLSLSQSIAKVHGGDIHVQSAAGKGSTFRVRLPLGSVK